MLQQMLVFIDSECKTASAIDPQAIQILTPGITSLLAAGELRYYVEASYFCNLLANINSDSIFSHHMV